jgi:hypothetical protein
MPGKDIDKIPITLEVPKADVWLRADYRDIVHRLGEVHLIRACEHQHDDDFVPMYDFQTIEIYQIEVEKLRREAERAWKNVDAIALERDEARALHQQLMFAVACKFDGESRHETALRYIREREAIEVAPVSKIEQEPKGWSAILESLRDKEKGVP